MGLQRLGDVHRVGAELEAPQHEQPLGPVVVPGVDLEIGRRHPEPTHADHPDRVDPCPGPRARPEQAAHRERVVGRREPGAGPQPEHRGHPDRDRRDAEQQSAGSVQRAEDDHDEQRDRADRSEDHRGERCGPLGIRVVHRLRPQWGRTTSM
ncbi:hypothetical protein Acsp07_57430 [Actinomycetospora sp. NBRC 106378]|nr:hypothetical protein Acsp07_57430 [Actinomycetospora sp. NBRC 106378]